MLFISKGLQWGTSSPLYAPLPLLPWNSHLSCSPLLSSPPTSQPGLTWPLFMAASLARLAGPGHWACLKGAKAWKAQQQHCCGSLTTSQMATKSAVGIPLLKCRYFKPPVYFPLYFRFFCKPEISFRFVEKSPSAPSSISWINWSSPLGQGWDTDYSDTGSALNTSICNISSNWTKPSTKHIKQQRRNLQVSLTLEGDQGPFQRAYWKRGRSSLHFLGSLDHS